MTYNDVDVLESSNLIELSKRLKEFLVSALTSAEIERLFTAVREFYTAVMRAALIAGHPFWYVAAGRTGAVLYLYRNWAKQDCLENDLQVLNSLASELSDTILDDTANVISETSAEEIMYYLDNKYGFSKHLLDDWFLLIFLLPLCVRIVVSKIPT